MYGVSSGEGPLMCYSVPPLCDSSTITQELEPRTSKVREMGVSAYNEAVRQYLSINHSESKHHDPSPAMSPRNHGRQTLSAQCINQRKTATTFITSKQFLVLPIRTCSRYTSFSAVLVPISKCQPCPCDMRMGMTGHLSTRSDLS